MNFAFTWMYSTRTQELFEILQYACFHYRIISQTRFSILIHWVGLLKQFFDYNSITLSYLVLNFHWMAVMCLLVWRIVSQNLQNESMKLKSCSNTSEWHWLYLFLFRFHMTLFSTYLRIADHHYQNTTQVDTVHWYFTYFFNPNFEVKSTPYSSNQPINLFTFDLAYKAHWFELFIDACVLLPFSYRRSGLFNWVMSTWKFHKHNNRLFSVVSSITEPNTFNVSFHIFTVSWKTKIGVFCTRWTPIFLC